WARLRSRHPRKAGPSRIRIYLYTRRSPAPARVGRAPPSGGRAEGIPRPHRTARRGLARGLPFHSSGGADVAPRTERRRQDDVPANRLHPPPPDVGSDSRLRLRCRRGAGTGAAPDRGRAAGGEAVLSPHAARTGVLLSEGPRHLTRHRPVEDRSGPGEVGASRGRGPPERYDV